MIGISNTPKRDYIEKYNKQSLKRFRSHWQRVALQIKLNKRKQFLWLLLATKPRIQVLVLLFVALWFILRGDLLYVLPCVILFVCFSVLLVLRLPRLGKRESFVRLFDLCLFGFVGFLFLLGSGKGCGLWLWHSLDFSLTFFYNNSWELRYTLTSWTEFWHTICGVIPQLTVRNYNIWYLMSAEFN